MKRYAKCLTSNICRLAKLPVSDFIANVKLSKKKCPSLMTETRKHSLISGIRTLRKTTDLFSVLSTYLMLQFDVVSQS